MKEHCLNTNTFKNSITVCFFLWEIECSMPYNFVRTRMAEYDKINNTKYSICADVWQLELSCMIIIRVKFDKYFGKLI
jgi:hypothetical protein